MSAEEIANKIWSSESDVSPLAVKTVVSRLKSKLCDANDDEIIQNAHGRGYCIRASGTGDPG
jgi:DNA-binding response OmpR family regulator